MIKKSKTEKGEKDGTFVLAKVKGMTGKLVDSAFVSLLFFLKKINYFDILSASHNCDM